MAQDIVVVTPTLNCRGYLPSTLSAVAGTAARVRHIVVDGASTDGTRDLVLRSGRAVLVDQTTTHRTMYAAINQGVRAAQVSSGWLAYVNGDDIPFPMALARLAAVGEETNADVVFGDAVFFWIEHARLRLRFQAAFRDAPSLLKSLVLPFTQPAAIFRYSLWKALGGFDDTMRIAGDLDFYVRGFQDGAKFAHFPGVVAGFRKTGQSLGDRNIQLGLSERAIIGARLSQTPSGPPVSARLRRHRDSALLYLQHAADVRRQVSALVATEL